MPERRKEKRPGSPDRRTLPRPPLWLNLLVLALGLAGVLAAQMHRGYLSRRFADVMTRQQRTPADARKVKEELAEVELTREALQQELDGRMKFLKSLQSEDFYLSVDTEARKLRFYYGDTVLREADLAIGPTATIEAPDGRSWTFIPLKGAFPVEAKVVGHDWRIPEWVYVMNNQPIPKRRSVIDGGLGEYVIFLPNGYVIHSPPSAKSPLKGPKPGSFMVAADDLRAIWPRIHLKKTQVYIF